MAKKMTKSILQISLRGNSMKEDIFDNYKLNIGTLLDYGFIEKENSYIYMIKF